MTKKKVEKKPLRNIPMKVRCEDCKHEYGTTYKAWKTRESTCPECGSKRAYGLQSPRASQ